MPDSQQHQGHLPEYRRWQLITWLLVFVAVSTWSAINPHDRITWWLEVSPALLGLVILAAVYRKFRFTPLVAWLILGHAVILMVGGHYTYAEVPLGDWVAEWSGGERNNYDKLGHLAQGFVPVLLAREIFIRLRVTNSIRWTEFLAVCVALAISAFYELLEWWVALASGEEASAFLGTQGYVWDTQSDMAWAMFSAIAAIVLLRNIHDRQLGRTPA